MYTMKEISRLTGLSYDTLKFYCNEGLIPNVKRDERNYRVFDDRDLSWISSLLCLRKCGMSLKEMKDFLDLCLEGESSIEPRMEILDRLMEELEQKKSEVEENLAYVRRKQQYYRDVLAGTQPYFSNLLPDYEGMKNPLEEVFSDSRSQRES